jgi:sugar O-acyltransferase (sialic acid O-acetyltransferase NeuD family)
VTQTLVAIYGAGGFAREVAWLARVCGGGDRQVQVVCFVDDDPSRHGEVLNGIPVLGLQAARREYPTARIVSGIGNPAARERVMTAAAAVGFEFLTLVHPRTEMSEYVELGPGTVICAGCTLTTNVALGRHVQINLDCTIGHDVRMDDYATLAPGVHISGWVHIGRRAYLGTGACVINGTAKSPLVIGEDAVIAAAACVVRTVPPGITVWGVPARPLRTGDAASG